MYHGIINYPRVAIVKFLNSDCFAYIKYTQTVSTITITRVVSEIRSNCIVNRMEFGWCLMIKRIALISKAAIH